MRKYRIVAKYCEYLYTELMFAPQVRFLGIWWPLSYGEGTEKDAMDVIRKQSKKEREKVIPKPRVVWTGEF